jgi:hypothetical protein
MRTVLKVVAFACILALMSCSKNNTDIAAIGNGYSYFPNDSTKQYFYSVDSIAYNKNLKRIDTFHYQLKTVLSNSFFDNSGIQTWRMSRYAKYSDTLDYVEIQNHFIQFYGNKFLYTENNAVLLKAVFPLKNELTWNGNLYNYLGYIKSNVNFINEPFVTSDTTFQNTVKITEWENKDFIFENYRFSVYQDKVGLVYFRNRYVETQSEKNEVSGFDISQKLISIK